MRGSPESIIAHHLRLVGVHSGANLRIMFRPGAMAAETIQLSSQMPMLYVVLQPQADFAAVLGVTILERKKRPPEIFRLVTDSSSSWSRLRTLHAADAFHHEAGRPVVCDLEAQPVWMWLSIGRGGILFVGTDLAGDLVRYRQGDPDCANSRPTEALWGIAGERPNYLFEAQLAGEDGAARHADGWAMALAETVAEKLGQPLADILPGGAPGAIVLTGDDDQAYLEKYDEQLALLGDTPITYLLHPLTRHTPKTLQAMRKRNRGVDFGIHPDALDAPQRYGELFDHQVAWYRGLTGASPVSLRNHGFLNDGYWGHLEAWLKHGVGISSNLPGFDGRILNGSLLPARMAWKGKLSRHWSVLTAIGDGVRIVSGMSDEDAADRIWMLADRIRQSQLPGVMVLNLHPQNVSDTRAMHLAAKENVRGGFVAWNLRQCWEWFARMDSCDVSTMEEARPGLLSRLWCRSKRRILA